MIFDPENDVLILRGPGRSDKDISVLHEEEKAEYKKHLEEQENKRRLNKNRTRSSARRRNMKKRMKMMKQKEKQKENQKKNLVNGESS